VETCEQLKLPDAKEYAEELKKAKKKKEVQQAVCLDNMFLPRL
jgi:acetyl-CoA carboxylase beta subunit